MIHAVVMATPTKGLFSSAGETSPDALSRSLGLTLSALPRERIWILATQSHKDRLVSQLSGKMEPQRILGEAEAKGSATSTAFASVNIIRTDPNPVLIILPPSPLTENEDTFIQTLGLGLKTLKQKDGFVVFGVRSPSFVLAQTDEELSSVPGVYAVSSLSPFSSVQEPQQDSWGLLPVLIFRARLYMDALKERLPSLFEPFMKLLSAFGTRDEERFFYETYRNATESLVETVLVGRKDIHLVESRF